MHNLSTNKRYWGFKGKGKEYYMSECCICGNIAVYVIYPKQCIKKDGSKSMFGICRDSVKYYCYKCYKSKSE